jgi:hypothetical protein
VVAHTAQNFRRRDGGVEIMLFRSKVHLSFEIACAASLSLLHVCQTLLHVSKRYPLQMWAPVPLFAA